MKEFIKTILELINKISYIIAMILVPLAILAEILNPSTFERLLTKLKIPLSFEDFLLVSYIILAVMVGTFFIRKILFDTSL